MREVVGQAEQKNRQELREQQTRQPTLLTQTLLGMYAEDGSRNDSYSSEALRDTCVNFLIAGRDTTALMLSWFFYLISQHPEAEMKIREEMDSVLGAPVALPPGGEEEEEEESPPPLPLPAPPSFEQLSRLPFLQSCLYESLRLYPPVPFNGFTALSNDVLPGGFFIPKQTYVTYSAFLMHRRADLYPDPERFWPERWMAGGVQGGSPKAYEFVAFHGGPRECMGREMALLEAKIAIVTLMRGCDGYEGLDAAGRAESVPATRPFTLRLHPKADVQLKRAIILTARKGMHMTIHDVA